MASTALVGYYTGIMIARYAGQGKPQQPALKAIIGIVILETLAVIPVLGLFVEAAVISLALGAAGLAVFTRKPGPGSELQSILPAESAAVVLEKAEIDK